MFHLGTQAAPKTSSTIRRRRPEALTILLTDIRVPFEFSRRTRPLDDGLKAEEYRNLALFFFPILLEELTDSLARKVRHCLTRISRILSPNFVSKCLASLR